MADNFFLQFPSPGQSPNGTITVKGQSNVPGFVGAIEIISFAVGISNTVTLGSASGGTGAGKVDFSSLTISKPVDSASTALYEASAEGAHFPQVLLSVERSGGTGPALTYLQYDFRLVYVTSVGWSGSSGEQTPLETLTLDFGALEISYKVQGPSGNPVSVVTGGWNRVTNTPSPSLPGG